MTTDSTLPGLQPIARPDGGLAMVAIDQRESLRTMMEEVSGSAVSDHEVVQFKVGVARRLSPIASAMLFDRQFGMHAFGEAATAGAHCGRIVAVDRLIQEPGQAVTDTDLDDTADVAGLIASGAVAFKFLVLWRGAENADRCVELAAQFVELCRAAGVIAILEAMVRPPTGDDGSWSRNDAIVDAARALGAVRPDLYKADVPSFGRGPAEEIQGCARQVTEAVRGPWVVLSNGVAIDDFSAAVQAACKGGASGFLAGRAVWADCLGDDYMSKLETISGPRLRQLVGIVDAHARPWATASNSAR